MMFNEVGGLIGGVPARLSVGPSAATNISLVHTLFMAVQPSFDLHHEEPRKRNELGGLQRSFRPKNYPNWPGYSSFIAVNSNRLVPFPKNHQRQEETL